MAHSSHLSVCFVKCHPKTILTLKCSFKTTKRYFETSFCFCRKKASSTKWLNRQLKDPFVHQAKQENWRCRSAFKLFEIDERFHLLKPGYTVVDCGAAPGSWTQVAVEKVCSAEPGSTNGKVISVDLQHIDPIEGAAILDESDFTSPDTQNKILKALGNQLADVVLSDMAPNASGTPSLDHDAIIQLCFAVLKFCTVVLKNDGSVVCKIWMGSDQEKLKSVMERMFKKVKYFKPEASRSDSAEMFLIGQGYFLRKQ